MRKYLRCYFPSVSHLKLSSLTARRYFSSRSDKINLKPLFQGNNVTVIAPRAVFPCTRRGWYLKASERNGLSGYRVGYRGLTVAHKSHLHRLTEACVVARFRICVHACAHARASCTFAVDSCKTRRSLN